MRIGKIIREMFDDLFVKLQLDSKTVERNICALSSSIVRGPMIYTEKVFYDLFSNEFNFKGFGNKPRTQKEDYYAQLNNTVKLTRDKGELKAASPTLIAAIKRTKAQLGIERRSLKPCTPVEAAAALESSSSSGFYYIWKKHTVRGQLARDASQILHDSSTSWLNYPSYIATKQQIRGVLSGLKTRLIYVFPGVVSTLENIFVVPLTRHLTDNPSATCLATGKVFHQIKEHHFHLSERYSHLLGFDFSAFDQHVLKELIRMAFFIIRDCFDMDKEQRKLFDNLVYYFTDGPVLIRNNGTPLLLADRKRGIPSGSGFTSLIGSIVNLIMINCFLIEHGLIDEDDLNQAQVLGDDSLIGVNLKSDKQMKPLLKTAAKYFSDSFCAVMNPEKCDVSRRFEPIYYLGYKIDSSFRYLDTERAMLQLMYSSREIEGLTLKERIFSKLCSICFKCWDGKDFFFKVWPKLAKYLKVSGDTIPDYYYDLKDARSPSDFAELDENVKNRYLRSVNDMMYIGFLIQ